MVMMLVLSISSGAFATTLPEATFYLDENIADNFEQKLEQDENLRKYGELAKVYNDFREEQSMENFGGAYYDDNGDLHILLTENAYSTTEKTLHDNVILETANYSYVELQNYQADVLERKEDIGFQSTGIRQSQNKVIVYTDDVDKLDYDLLYLLIPQDAVNVEYSIDETVNNTTFTVSPGDKIGLNSSMSSYGTISCGVVWGSDDTYGIMTAGHMGDEGTTVYYNGTNIGDITEKKESGSIDVALIDKEQTSHTLNLSRTVSGIDLDYNGGTWPEGTPVTAYGASSGEFSGEITDTDFSGTFDGISFTGLIKTDAVSQGGDSGAPYVTPYSDTYCMIGVHKGASGGNAVYVDMQKVKDWFDLNLAGD